MSPQKVRTPSAETGGPGESCIEDVAPSASLAAPTDNSGAPPGRTLRADLHQAKNITADRRESKRPATLIANHQAEAALLGCLLLGADLADLDRYGIGPESFTRPDHRAVYSAVTELTADGRPIDPVLLADVLENRGDIPKLLDRRLLLDLTEAAPAISNAPHYAEIVADYHRRRQMQALTIELGNAARDGTDPTDILERARALGLTDGTTTFRARLVTGADVLDLPPPDPLVGTWMDRATIVVIPAPFGAGKTHLLVDLAYAIGTGHPWMGQPVHHTGHVWYFIGEGVYTVRDRVRAWMIRHDEHTPPDTVHFYPATFNLDQADSTRELRAAVERIHRDGQPPPAMMIFDTWSRYISGGEVPEITKPAMATLEQLRDLTGAAIVVPTHTGHNVQGRSRGDSTLEDNADIVIPVLGRLRDENGQPVPVRMINTKQKARALQPPMWLKLREIADPDPPEHEPTKTLAWVEPVAGADIDEDRDTQQTIMARLVDFIARHEGKHTASQLVRINDEDGTFELKDIGSQRTRQDCLALMIRTGVVAQKDTDDGRARLFVGDASAVTKPPDDVAEAVDTLQQAFPEVQP